MRILICIPHDLESPRGNSIAALRLKTGFEKKGHNVSIFENCESKDKSMAVAFINFIEPDIAVVMHAWRCAAVFLGIHSTGSVPVIVSLRGTDINEMIEDTKRGPEICSVLESCQGIAVFSETVCQKVIKYLPASGNKIQVIPNGLDLPVSHVNYRNKLGIDRDAFVFIGLAGIRHEKRIIRLLEMLSELRTKGNNVLYLHAGPILDEKEGCMFQYFCIDKSWIRYAGIIPHNEAGSFLKAGNVFVSASRSEGMPHAVREAMLAGLPCLLSDIESHRYMTRNGTEGLLFADEKGFADKAIMLMNDKELRDTLARNSCNSIKSELARSSEIDSYLAFFEAVIKHGTSQQLP